MLTGDWNMDQRKVIVSQMVGLSKISLINIIIKSRNLSILVLIFVFKLRTEFPGKLYWLGRPVLKWGVGFKSLHIFFPILLKGWDSLFSCRIFLFSCFVVPKLLEKRMRYICHTTISKTDSCDVTQNHKRNHLFLIILLSPLPHRCRLPVDYS